MASRRDNTFTFLGRRVWTAADYEPDRRSIPSPGHFFCGFSRAFLSSVTLRLCAAPATLRVAMQAGVFMGILLFLLFLRSFQRYFAQTRGCQMRRQIRPNHTEV